MRVEQGESSPVSAAISSAMRGSPLPRGAIGCTNYIVTARALWPRKTAEHWALQAGVKPRMAKYWLSGDHPVSADGKLAILRQFD